MLKHMAIEQMSSQMQTQKALASKVPHKGMVMAIQMWPLISQKSQSSEDESDHDLISFPQRIEDKGGHDLMHFTLRGQSKLPKVPS